MMEGHRNRHVVLFLVESLGPEPSRYRYLLADEPSGCCPAQVAAEQLEKAAFNEAEDILVYSSSGRNTHVNPSPHYNQIAIFYRIRF
jgi:hypothetical protein